MQPKVQMLGQTTIFDITKPSITSMENVPTFYPLQTTGRGMTKDDPYVYDGGVAPMVPFVVISHTVQRIDVNAFFRNKRLERIVIPKHVTHIGYGAFGECPDLVEVIFEEPSSLVEIEMYAFSVCEKIEEIRLPDSLEKLRRDAFGNCKGLRRVTLSSKMTTIEMSTFSDCESLTSVERMHSITNIKEWAFSGCSSLKSIDVNANADIHDDAFLNCKAKINRIL